MKSITSFVKATPNWVLFFIGAFLLYFIAKTTKH